MGFSETILVYDVKVGICGLGHIINMAAMPIYGKKLKKSFALEPKSQ